MTYVRASLPPSGTSIGSTRYLGQQESRSAGCRPTPTNVVVDGAKNGIKEPIARSAVEASIGSW
jgi:hypothetical protein